MARLPTVGGDDGDWGTVLNQFLQVSHNNDGSLKNLFINVKDYGAVGDGTTDDTAAIQAAVTAGNTFIPAGTYRITSTITIPSNRRIVGSGHGTVLRATAAASGTTPSYLKAEGSDGAKANLTANVANGSRTVTLPSGAGAGFEAGDFIGLESQAVVAATTGLAREIHKIISITGDTLTLDASLTYSYATADSAQYWKLSPVVGVELANFVMESSSPTTLLGHSIALIKVASYLIENIRLRNMGGGIGVRDGIDGFITNVFIDRLPNYASAFGYGVWLAGSCMNTTINNLSGRGCRHLVTTLADQRGSVFWGGPIGVSINGGVAFCDENSFTAWDTHEFGRDIVFNGCVAIGGGSVASHFQVRAQNVQLIGCQSSMAGLRAIAVTNLSNNVRIVGGIFDSCRGTAGAVSLAGTNAEIVGARVSNSSGAGIVISGTNSVVRNCDIRDNATYGIQNLSSTNTVIQGNYIPRGTHSQGILSPGATTSIIGNYMSGYSGSNVPIYLPDAATIVYGNVVDTIPSVSSAATVTLPAYADLITVTGGVTITSITASSAGRSVILKFASSLTVTNGSNLILRGNAAVTANSTLSLTCDGTNWIETARSIS